MTSAQNITQLFTTLLDAATHVGLAAAALFLAWAGFLYMTAGGSPRRPRPRSNVSGLSRIHFRSNMAAGYKGKARRASTGSG